MHEKLRADFNKREYVRTSNIDWVPSPAGGVDRKPLDRIGGEVARATSLVRYAENSEFPRHSHNGGEEFFVIEGVFSDEHGDFPAGTYVRNPIGTAHTPASRPGCVIFVKLWQFDPQDRKQFRIDTNAAEYAELGDGVWQLSLHQFKDEHAALWRMEAGSILAGQSFPLGVEIYVLSGDFEDTDSQYSQGDWIRNPPGFVTDISSQSGCRLLVKSGHLGEGADTYFRKKVLGA